MADKLDRVKFAKVCEMMTSSHEGERSAATVRANAMLKAAGLNWTQALAPPPPTVAAFKAGTPSPPPRGAAEPLSEEWFRTAAEQYRRARSSYAPRKPKQYAGWAPEDFSCLDLAKLLEQHEFFDELDDKHKDFIVEQAVNTGRPYSEKQRKYLEDLAKKLDRMLRTQQHHY